MEENKKDYKYNVKKNKLLTEETAMELKKNSLCKDCKIK